MTLQLWFTEVSRSCAVVSMSYLDSEISID